MARLQRIERDGRMVTVHPTAEDCDGWYLYPRKNRNLLNSQGSDVRKGTLGKRNTTRGLTDTLVTRADGSQHWIRRNTRKPKLGNVATDVSVTLGYRVNMRTAPKRSLSAIASYGMARGWDVATIRHLLDIHRMRPCNVKPVEVSMSDTWARKG